MPARMRGLLLGLFRSRRRLVVVLGFRIEELAGGGDRLGGRIAVLVAGRDVLAAVDALGLVLAARNRDGDLDLDLGVNGDVIVCLPMVLIGASSCTCGRSSATPSASNAMTMSRTVTEPNSWPASDA